MRNNTENMATCESAQPTFVPPEEFHRLAISNRQLDRRDDRRAGLKGLYDAGTGEWFVVEEDRLYIGQ
jgi:hypothetical protein